MRILIFINLLVQIVLVLAIFVAGYLAKKGQFQKHCLIMRIAAVVQVLAIASTMLPSMLGYVRYGFAASWFNVEIWIHHILGLAVIAIWIYVNLVFLNIIKSRYRLVVPMRLAFVLWLIVLALGFHLYILIWT